MALLEVRGLTVRRGTRTVLEAFDLDLEGGMCARIEGENGAGKSTLIEAVAGLLPVHAGTVLRDRPFGLVLQAGGVHGDETVSERLGFAAAAAGVVADDAVLDRWGLGHRAADRIGHLSGGLRRRLEVLQGLLPGYGEAPRLLLLDEPSEGLDASSVETLVEDLLAMRSRGHAILLASHDPRLDAVASHRLDLSGGIVVDGTPSDATTLHLSESPPRIEVNRWAATLDRRTKRQFLTRGVPWLAATLVLFALLGSNPGPLLLLPTFLAALAPLTSLHHARENRAGDWWRAMGGCISAPEGFSTVFLLAAPLLTAKLLSVPTEGWAIYALGLPFCATLLASGAIQELAMRMPRANAQYVPLLMLMLAWPFLIATEVLSHPTPWQPLLLAFGLPFVLSFALPLLHPRTGSD